MKKTNRLDILKKNPLDKKEKINIHQLMKELVICGDTKEVTEKIIELKEKYDKMTTLTYVNVDWTDKKLTKKSMKLLGEKVIPNIK